MEGFSADWLALREPADHAARAHALAGDLAGRLARRADPALRAVDLAAGTGSNVRYLLPRLPAVAHWTLVDHDAALLAQAWRLLSPLLLPAGRSFDVRGGDLNDVASLPLDGCALVTASALLDLVAEPWLHRLATRCRREGADALFALTYDGRIDCTPALAFDARVRDLVNAHQRTDKGFGPALGPDAARRAAAVFGAAGYTVTSATSDWVLDPSQAELQRQLVHGWAGAARELASPDAAEIEAWLAQRLAWIDAGASTVRVGHVDVSARA